MWNLLFELYEAYDKAKKEKAKAEADTKAKQVAEAKAREEAILRNIEEVRARKEAEARAKEQAKAREEAEAKAREEAEVRARLKAKENAIRAEYLSLKTQEACDRAQLFVNNFEEDWYENFKGFVLLDSNIWMGKNYDDLFDGLEVFLQKSKQAINILEVQFDEIVNLKDLPYKDEKSQAARLALSRIEKFQKLKIIDIDKMGISAHKKAYADPEILKLLLNPNNLFEKFHLIADDRELRIRANALVSDDNSITIMNGEEIRSAFVNYLNNLKLINYREYCLTEKEINDLKALLDKEIGLV